MSELLRNLSVVEFSFYLGYPVLQIAEREYCSPAKCWASGREHSRWWTSFSQMKYLTAIQNRNEIKLELLMFKPEWVSRALLSHWALVYSSLF